MASVRANEASEVLGSSREASWGHPCGRRRPRASLSPVPDLGTGPFEGLGTGNEMRVRDWRSPGAASARERAYQKSSLHLRGVWGDKSCPS